MTISKTIQVQGLNAVATTPKVRIMIRDHMLEAVLGSINILGIPGLRTLDLKKRVLQALPITVSGSDRHAPKLRNTSVWRYRPIPTKSTLKGSLISLLQRLEKQGCIVRATASTYQSPGWGVAKSGKLSSANSFIM